jgi:hypothetical protein
MRWDLMKKYTLTSAISAAGLEPTEVFSGLGNRWKTVVRECTLDGQPVTLVIRCKAGPDGAVDVKDGKILERRTV